ncbi:hypothetical protein K1718_18115 [Roseibium porphyridii]|uniref:Uncharacterized protein n=1 Tax=Roseibium porphyridii TaxID=2866279 RepID=A0ABY8EYA4_9HYPH|nr:MULTISPECIES: hypothetical protein [Stappiaceae]QFT32749.1 hypothetical protein FIV00_19825 [Labrenzia sp. THAF82]WFE88073.1 hypothetical protein K1718_18115 [Roseibium sp. KMA01]
MLHTGDSYELRARSLRNQELRRLTDVFSRFLFRSTSSKRAHKRFEELQGANDLSVEVHRAA